MSVETILRLLSGILLIGANGFFVATEFALTRVRQFPKSDFEGHAGLRRAWKMTDELEIYLTGCQVGITFTSILLGIVVEPAVTSVLQPLLTLIGFGEQAAHGAGLVVGLIILNLIHTIWAEQTPTYLGIEKAKLVAKYCAIPHHWWTRAVYPLLLIGDASAKWTLSLFGIHMSRSWIEAGDQDDGNADGNSSRDKPGSGVLHVGVAPSRGQLIEKMGELLKRGRLADDRRDEVLQTVLIGQISTEEIMVPREKITFLSTNDSFDEVVAKIGESKHTRYPIVGSNLDDFRGIIYLPEMFAHLQKLRAGSINLEEIASPPMTVEYDLPVSKLIDCFQEQHHELALVVKQTFIIGLVTLTDAVEKIVGEVEDPLDVLLESTATESTEANETH